MKLESGPAAYDRNYYIIFLVLCVALGGYFYYDYNAGYLKKNHEEARKMLLPLVGAQAIPEQLPAHPTGPEFKDLLTGNAKTPDAFRQKFGKPLASKSDDTGKTFDYYASRYGMGVVVHQGGKVLTKESRWNTWFKSKDEIKFQLYCAFICFVVALYALYRVVKAATLKAVIDDEGMTYGNLRIPFTSMKRLCDYSPKGWVDLYYDAGGQQRKLRIDNQKIRKFDEIIDALCEATGFPDPRSAGKGETPASDEQ